MPKRSYILVSYEGKLDPRVEDLLGRLKALLMSLKPQSITVKTIHDGHLLTIEDFTAFLEANCRYRNPAAVSRRIFNQLFFDVRDRQLSLVVICRRCDNVAQECTCHMYPGERINEWVIEKESLAQLVPRIRQVRNIGEDSQRLLRRWLSTL